MAVRLEPQGDFAAPMWISNLAWPLLRRSLIAADGPHPELLLQREGYVPSDVAVAWSNALTNRGTELVVVSTWDPHRHALRATDVRWIPPMPRARRRWWQLTPARDAALAPPPPVSTLGEQSPMLSHDLALVLLPFSDFCTLSRGFAFGYPPKGR